MHGSDQVPYSQTQHERLDGDCDPEHGQ